MFSRRSSKVGEINLGGGSLRKGKEREEGGDAAAAASASATSWWARGTSGTADETSGSGFNLIHPSRQQFIAVTAKSNPHDSQQHPSSSRTRQSQHQQLPSYHHHDDDHDHNLVHEGVHYIDRRGASGPFNSYITEQQQVHSIASTGAYPRNDIRSQASNLSLYRLAANHTVPPTPDPASTSSPPYRPISLPPPPRVPSDSVRKRLADSHRTSAAQLYHPVSDYQRSPAKQVSSQSTEKVGEVGSWGTLERADFEGNRRFGEAFEGDKRAQFVGGQEQEVIISSEPPTPLTSVAPTRGSITFGSPQRTSAYPPSSSKRASASSSTPTATASTASRSRPTSHASTATSALPTSQSSATSATPRSRTISLTSAQSGSLSAHSSTASKSISARVSSIFKRAPRHTAPPVLKQQSSEQALSHQASRTALSHRPSRLLSHKTSGRSTVPSESDDRNHPSHSSGSKSSETATAGPDSPGSASTLGKSNFVRRTLSRLSPRKPSSLRSHSHGSQSRITSEGLPSRPVSVAVSPLPTRSLSRSTLATRPSSLFLSESPSRPTKTSTRFAMTQVASRTDLNRSGPSGSAISTTRNRSGSTAASTMTATSSNGGSVIVGSSSRGIGFPRQPSRQSILNHTHAPNATLTVQLSPAQQYQQTAAPPMAPVVVPASKSEEPPSPGIAEAPRFQRRRADSELQTVKEKGKRGLLGKVKEDHVSSLSGDEANTSTSSSKARMGGTFASLRKLIRSSSSRRKSLVGSSAPGDGNASVSGRSRAGSSTLPTTGSAILTVPETSEFGALLPPITPTAQLFPSSPTPQSAVVSTTPQSPQPSASLRSSDEAPKRARSTSRSGMRSPFRARDNPKDVAARRASDEGSARSERAKSKGKARDMFLSESGPDEADEVPLPTLWGERQDSQFSSLRSARGPGLNPPSPPLTPTLPVIGSSNDGQVASSSSLGRAGRDRSLTIQALSANSPISGQRKSSGVNLGSVSPLLAPRSPSSRADLSDTSSSFDGENAGVALTTGRSEEEITHSGKAYNRSIPSMWRGSNHDIMPGALHIDDEISEDENLPIQGPQHSSRFGSSTNTATSFQTATDSPPQQMFTSPLPSKSVQQRSYSTGTSSLRSPGSPPSRFLFPSPSTPINSAAAGGSPQTQTGHSGRSLNSFGVPHPSRDPPGSTSDIVANMEHRAKQDVRSSQDYSLDGTSSSNRDYLMRPAIAAGPPSSVRSTSQPSSAGFSPGAIYAQHGSTTIDKMSMSDVSTSPSTYQRRRNTFGGGEVGGEPAWTYDSQISLLQSSQAHVPLRSPDGEISVEEIESNVAAVEAALRDHYLAGSFDPSSLRRRLVSSDAHRRRLSHNVEEEDELTDDALIPSIPDEVTTPERVTLAPTSRNALAAAVSQVRKALSSSQLRRDLDNASGQENQPPSQQVQQREPATSTAQPETTPARAARMRVESMRDVEEAYTRMCSIVTQAAVKSASPVPPSVPEETGRYTEQQPSMPLDSPTLETTGERERAQSVVVLPSARTSALTNESRFQHRYTRSGSGIVTPSSLSGLMGMGAGSLRAPFSENPHLRQRSSSSSLDDRQAATTRLRLISESNAAAHAAARRAAAIAASKRMSVPKQTAPPEAPIEKRSGSAAHSRSASGNGGSGHSGTSPSASAKTQGTPRSIDRISPTLQRRSGESKRASSDRPRPEQSLLQQLHEEEDNTTTAHTDAGTSTALAASQNLGNAFEAKPLTLINAEKRRSLGIEEARWSSRSPLHANLRPSTGQANAPTLGTYRDSNVPSWRDWQGASAGSQSTGPNAAMNSPLLSSGQSYAPSTGRSYRHSVLYEDESRASQDRSTASPVPTASLQTIMRRHALERDSLLDVLERTRATASDAQRRNETLEAELHHEVTRVLELQRELGARTQREQSLERRVTQLELALSLQRGENQRLEEAVALSSANAAAASRVRVQSNVPFEMLSAPTSQQGLSPSPRASMPVSERLVGNDGETNDADRSFISRGDSSGAYTRLTTYDSSSAGLQGSEASPMGKLELGEASELRRPSMGNDPEWALQDEQPPADLQSDTDSEREDDEDRRRSFARSRPSSSRHSGASSRIANSTARIVDESATRTSIGSPSRVIPNGFTRAKSDTNSVASSSAASRISRVPSLSARQQRTHTPSGSLSSSIGAGAGAGAGSVIGSPIGSGFGSGRRMPSVLKQTPSRIPTSTSANSRVFSAGGSSFTAQSESPLGEYIDRFDGRDGYWDERRPANYDPVAFPPHHQAHLDESL